MIRELHCYALVCDVCGESSDCAGEMVDQHFQSAEMARSEALLYGWSRPGGRDVCPDCASWVLSTAEPIPYALTEAAAGVHHG